MFRFSASIRPSARRVVAGCALLITAAAAPARSQGQPAVASEPPVVRHYEEFSEMSAEQKRRAHPIDLEGDVIYVDPRWKMMFVRTGGWMHYIETGGAEVEVRAGQRVRVTGTHVPSGYLIYEELRFEVLGDTPPMEYPNLEDVVTSDSVSAGVVIAHGLVDAQAMADDTHVSLDVVSGGSRYPVRIVLEPGAPIPRFTGAYIRAQGLYNPRRDVNHIATGFELLVAGPGDVEVTGWLATDPAFDREVVAIGDLVRASADTEVHVVGTVHSRVPGQSITLRDDTGQVVVASGQAAEIGIRLAAVGVPRVEGLHWILGGGRVRPIGRPVNNPETFGVPVWRMVGQVLALSGNRAAIGGPVLLAGPVVWSHPSARHFYLVDITGGVRVDLADGVAEPEMGTMVSLEGHTHAGTFAPGVVARTLRSLGSIAVPEARDITFEQALTGMEDGQWVALRGLVRAVTHADPWSRVELSTPGGDLAVFAPRDASLDARVGALVRARGICSVQADERRRLTGVTLWMPSARELIVEEPALADPFALREVPIGDLRRFTTLQSANKRIRISGTVTHHEPGRYLYLQDATDALQVLSREHQTLQAGDRVEVVGLPGSDLQRLVLREAVYRRIEAGAEPVPEPISGHLSPDPAYEGRLVRLDARVLERTLGAQETHLLLERDGMVFSARFEGRDARIDTIEAQSVVGVTGVYSVIHDEFRRPRAFRVQLRRGEDITLIDAPPWMNARRAAALSGVLVVVLVLGLVWVQLLRGRVRRQTDQIRTQLASEAELMARQRDILENANDCIFTTDLEGRLTAFNRAGERLTGYTRDEALHLHLRELFAATGDGARALAQLRTVEGGGTTFETRFRRKDGEVVWVEVSSRLVAVDGRPTGILGIVRDVGERRKFEDELAAARDAAQASAAAKGSFLANMSHEVRTPMNGVIGMANLLLDTPLAREQRDFAETIRDSAEGLLTILNDILDFSKIEAGKLQFESVPFDLASVVDGTLDLLASRAAAKGLQLAAFVPRSVPARLVGDPGRLRQVLLNLVGNAIKFTEKGEVVVHVDVVATHSGQALLCFEVIDTGLGLSDEAQGRMFRPFEQADASTTRRFGGTGLGLAISRQIVDLMHGQIGVRSRLGEGSTFWFTARFKCGAVATGQVPVTLRDGRILVLDANGTTRRIVADHLASWDATVMTASGVDEALAAARVAADDRRSFDLALVDPDFLDGHTLTAVTSALRAQPGCGNVRVIGLVPAARRLDGTMPAVPGLLGLVSKPVRRDALIEAVRHALAGGDLLDATAATRPAAPAGAAHAPAGLAESPAGGDVTVLVVEDNIVNQRVARLLLGKEGVRIEVASNGLEAIAALERRSYAAVFMDCQMPEMDGYEATRRIRAGGRHDGLRIIAMTANAMEGDRERCLAAGMDDYVSKPMRPDELLAALERAGVRLGQVRDA